MNQSVAESRPLTQILRWGSIHQERISPPDTLFANTGRKIYVLGDIDGRFRARSNPYDLHSFGRPHPQDPLAEKLQGVWAQPVKGMAGYSYTLRVNGQTWALEDAESFTQAFAFCEFQYRRDGLLAARRDFAAQDLPILFSTLSLKHELETALEIEVAFAVQFDLQDAWFTHLGEQRNTGQEVSIEDSRLVARSAVLPDRWAAAVSALPPATKILLDGGNAGQMVYSLHLLPGEEISLVFGMAVESQGGAPAALALLEEHLPRHASLLAEKTDLYAGLLQHGPRLVSPDSALNDAFQLALANLQMLEAESPEIGRYFYAGLEIFPFWFSNDGAYSVPGLMTGGFVSQSLQHIRIGLNALDEGRVPHQISPSGKVAFAGNAQETPLWVMSIWDAYRWTGDRDFLKEMFPGAWKGMFQYVLDVIDSDGDGYPSGPGMVEAEGMGAEKLDTAAYTWAALLALANMGEALGDAESAASARERARKIAAHFDVDWWDETSGTYCMSLEDPGNLRLQVPHWAVIVPLEVGLGTSEHAVLTLATLRKQYLNRWGLKHTVGEDERVWTLPTATLSRAAYRYGEDELGESMLRHVADTLQAGSTGCFHELIPEGACIIQLWSAATFLRGIVEDLLGITVNAGAHFVRVAPRLPVGWGVTTLENLVFGTHLVSVRVEPGEVRLEHLSGMASLQVEVQFPAGEKGLVMLGPGKRAVFCQKFMIDKPV
jgi:hypothetical protein